MSSVTDMSSMFGKAEITCDMSRWNVSSVTDMGWMFYNSSAASGGISLRDVPSVKNMRHMFV